jgi:predicted RNA methylase
MNYPDIETYQALYAKYLKRPVSDLLNLAGDLKGKVIWDLCCGGGEIAESCFLRHAARVVAVDSSWNMIKEFAARHFNPEKVFCYNNDISTFLRAKDNEELVFEIEDKPDIVFCRQAVNYWLHENTVRSLAFRMPEGSQFIFNTFNTRPSENPMVKNYEYNGHNFVEVSWLVKDVVYHIQIRDGLPPHETQFKWISKEEFSRILGGWYAIDMVEDGHTSLYRCTRRV